MDLPITPSVAGSQTDALGRMALHRVLPVVEVDTVDDATRLLDALVAGGLPAAEITLRTEAGMDAIRAVRRSHPDALVGAGTVRSAGDAHRAIDAGAEFIVSPITDRDVIEVCRAAGVPIVPGACTPNEAAEALRAGVGVVKFFPAQTMGGAAFLKALSGPFPELRFMPSGGLNRTNIVEYLRLPQVLTCGASWIVARELVAAGEFGRIEELVREVVGLVAEVRADA
jgi:2-dehydro-3-deoxyphosphogluconate aldolase/(4S)-4-hydroxy-2-oxoglutarate aldolase